HDRPVTPEVAGSSPVAPVKALQISMYLACRSRAAAVDRAQRDMFGSACGYLLALLRLPAPADPHAWYPGTQRASSLSAGDDRRCRAVVRPGLDHADRAARVFADARGEHAPRRPATTHRRPVRSVRPSRSS